MKYVNLIKLLSALLCAVLLFSACSDPAEPDDTESVDSSSEAEDTTEPESEERDPDPILKNFFENKYTQPILKDAERLEGEYDKSSANGTLTVFRELDVDFLNNRTVTYTVYNAYLEKTVLTIGNTYADGVFDTFDWNNIHINEEDMIPDVNGEKRIPKYPESVMEIKLHQLPTSGAQELSLIEVRKATITPIEEEVVEENEGDFYTVKIVSEFYDMAGEKILSLDVTHLGLLNYLPNVSSHSNSLRFNLYGCAVTLNAEDGTLLSVVNSDNEVVFRGYDVENETYGYYLEGAMNGVFGVMNRYVEVYDKEKNECVLHYDLDASDSTVKTVLSNGNLMIQYQKLVDGENGASYSYWDESTDRYYSVDTYIVKVPTGDVMKVECDYVFSGIYDRDTFAKIIDLEKDGILVSENAANIGLGMQIKDQKIDEDDLGILVLNNSGKVIFKMDKIIPEHDIDFIYSGRLGYRVLSTGDYLVTLDTVVQGVTHAITTADGKVRSYLKTDEAKWIADTFIVLEDGVYDHDRKLVYSFAEEELQREAVIGSKILVSKLVEEERLFFELTKGEEGELVLSEALFESEVVTVASSNVDYLILKNAETGKYTMYNAYLEHVLTTHGEMNVTVRDGKYLVRTTLDSHMLYYTIGQ